MAFSKTYRNYDASGLWEGTQVDHRTLGTDLHGWDKPWLMVGNGGRSSQINVAKHMGVLPEGIHADTYVTSKVLMNRLFDVGDKQNHPDAPTFTAEDVAKADNDALEKMLMAMEATYKKSSVPRLLRELTSKDAKKQPNFQAEAERAAMHWADTYSMTGDTAATSTEFAIWVDQLTGPTQDSACKFVDYWVTWVQDLVVAGNTGSFFINLEAGKYAPSTPTRQETPGAFNFVGIAQAWSALKLHYPDTAKQIADTLQSTGVGPTKTLTLTGYNTLANETLAPSIYAYAATKQKGYAEPNIAFQEALGAALSDINYYYLVLVQKAAPVVDPSSQTPAIPGKGGDNGDDKIALAVAALAVAGIGVWAYSRL